MSRLPDTKIVRDREFITIRIPACVVAGMTQEYWDMLATNARRLVPDVTPVENLRGVLAGAPDTDPARIHG